ncbi:MAG: sulfurtransferase [Actinomycetota bacterium]
MPTLPPILGAADLAALDPPPVLADVRSYPDGRDGREEFLRRHLPGAVLVDLDTDLAGPPSPGAGRHPLPEPEDFAAAMRRIGVSSSTPVVAYDDADGMYAGRLVVMLRWLGHPAALLDGGLGGWTGPTESGEATEIEPGDLSPTPWPSARFVEEEAVDEHLADGGTVIDARAAARYRGEAEPIDAVAGHIPGAVNRPFTDNLDGSGRFREVDELRERFDGLGERPIVYCGSGVSACNDLLAMEHAGIDDARLYVGSWSAWSADPDRDVATGD